MLGVDNVLNMSDSTRVRNLQKLVERCYKCLSKLVVCYSVPLQEAIAHIKLQIKTANELPLPAKYLRGDDDTLVETSKYPLAPIIRDIYTILTNAIVQRKTADEAYEEILLAMQLPRWCSQEKCEECTGVKSGNADTCLVKGRDALDGLHMLVQAPIFEYTRTMLIELILECKDVQDSEDIPSKCIDVHDNRCQFVDEMDSCSCYNILKDAHVHFLACRDPTCAFCSACRFYDIGKSPCKYFHTELQYAIKSTDAKTCPAVVNGCLNPACEYCPDTSQAFKLYLDKKVKTGNSLQELEQSILDQRTAIFNEWLAAPHKVVKQGWFQEEYEDIFYPRPVAFYTL